MSTPENPMAFPSAIYGCTPEGGMTLRDWFAGQVAPAVLTQLWADLKANRGTVDDCYKVASAASYEMADAMLATCTEAIDGINALLARVEALEEALGWFLTDERFIVSVGGNPNVVDKMLSQARAALEPKP